MGKIRVVFEEPENPSARGVRYVGINFDADPPMVFATYLCSHREDVPMSVRDSGHILVVPVENARERYEFVEKGPRTPSA